MMKQILLGCVCFISLTYTHAQTVVLSENFDAGFPGSWTRIKNDAFTEHASVSEFSPGWIIASNPDSLNDSVVAATSYFTTSGKASRWLISPPIALGAFGNFIKWKAMSFDPSYPDSYKVLISTTTNAISSFTDTVFAVDLESDLWIDREVNLVDSMYANQTVYVAFVLDTDGGFKLLLNDFEARKDDPLSISVTALNSPISVYPNPTQNIIHFSSTDYHSVELYDASGKLMTQSQPVTSLSLASFQSGIYFLKITATNFSTSIIRVQKL